MKFALFIAQRYSKNTSSDRVLMSKPMMRIATFGIVIGMAVMIAAVAIITGFKQQITEKVTGFSSHIQLVNRDMNQSYEAIPITNNWDYLNEIPHYDGVENLYPYVTKPGVIKENDEIEAIILKGIDHSYDWSFFDRYMVTGSVLKIDTAEKNSGIVLSAYIANRLNLNVGDDVDMFFMQNPVRMRRFVLEGIYETNLKAYDELYAMVDLRHLQKLNSWNPNQYSGFEIKVEKFNELEKIEMKISKRIALDFNENNESLEAISTLEIAPQIYDWLQLQNMNVWVILILITLVAGINMVTGLLINILEKTNQIGLFKALGARDKQIMQIFLFNAGRIIGKGMLWGNIIGIGLCFVQYQWGIIKLDPDNYYLSEVPVNFNWLFILLLNAGAFTVNIIMMLLPAMIVSRIRPVQAISFD